MWPRATPAPPRGLVAGASDADPADRFQAPAPEARADHLPAADKAVAAVGAVR